ncbi:MAG: hypothetical protein VB060_04880 [Oscillibacter sp.]|nr:hypothetical protein [Oscillibacter sp.]MEA4993159.1 hypothetical protein [Oscillibacter sp.]
MKRKTKEKAAAAAITAAAAAGVLIGGVFQSPAELLENTPAEQTNAVADAVDDGGAEDEGEVRARGGVRVRLKKWVLGLPLAVRAGVGLPLWGLGWALTTGLSFLLTGAVAPAVGTALSFVALGMLLLLALAGTAKAMFPDVKLRKLLSLRNMLGVCFGVGLLGLLRYIGPLVWPGYEAMADAIRVGGSFAVLLLGCVACGRRQYRLRERAAETAGADDGRTEVEHRAMELADTVCAPRH